MPKENPTNTRAEAQQPSARFWAIVPAAGIGLRMGADRPKQYLTIGRKTLLEHTLERLLEVPNLAGLVVALHPDDQQWQSLPLRGDSRVAVVDGGRDRSRSVLNALNSLTLQAAPNDWALVHDAARPCVRLSCIANLCRQTLSHGVGGILGVPVGDTLKQVSSQQTIQKTLDRQHLWQAQTPQLFRFQLLHQCLARAVAQGETITDEASALELAGYQPLIVEGRHDNLKVTRAEDLALAEMILKYQETQQ